MRKLLVTGGTVFVSRYVAEYYAKKGDEVYVLNRNHHTQPVEQRNYFSFYDYEYRLDVSAEKQWMPDTMLLADGLKEAYEWYQTHADCVRRKDFISYIDEHFV